MEDKRILRKVKILADSVSDITRENAEKLGIEIVPLIINFMEESYLDGETITAQELFKKMEGNNEFPTTSQVTPVRFFDHFKKYIDEDMDIVVITMSGELSGTYQSAVLASQNFPEKRVFVIDSSNVTGGEYVLVKLALKLRDKGKSAEEIYNEVLKAKEKVKSKVALDTLEFLIRSGRISKVAGFVGGMLGIKPIITISEGKLHAIAKERGTKKAVNHVLESLKNENLNENSIVCLAHSSQPEGLRTMKDYLEENNIPYDEIHIGGVTASHVGPNASAYFLIP